MSDQPTLVKKEEGLVLVGPDGMELMGDFRQMLPRVKPQNLNGELVVHAAKIKNSVKREDGTPYVVWDATAGMGEDSFLLAAAGFHVVLFEQDPVIAALLEDALQRGLADPALTHILQNMHFHHTDSVEYMKQYRKEPSETAAPDVIFLDPMFPKRQKSGLVKKKFQLLQQLEAPCDQEEELLAAAKALHPQKIIIKRPKKGPYLAGQKPSYELKGGKAVRFDCIVLPKIQ